MNIKNVAVVTAGLVIVMIIFTLISISIFKHNPRSLDLTEVSYDREQIAESIKVSLIDIKAKQWIPLSEDRGQSLSVPEDGKEIEDESYKGSTTSLPDNAVQADVESKNKNARLEDRETDVFIEEGPPTERIVMPIPKFKPIVNDTGPIPQGLDVTQNELPRITENYDYDDSSAYANTESKSSDIPGQQYSYYGPPIPPGLKTKPLPLYIPINSKTGPVATNKNRELEREFLP